MKTYHVMTVFPEMIEQASEFGVLGQALKSNKLSIKAYSPRVFTQDVHKTIDDRPFGGGDGMLMMAEPLAQTLASIVNPGPVIYLSPQGSLFNDRKARALAELESFTLICGRYAGVDQRFLNQHVDEELSLGDFVLSGGELAALAVIDATARFVPGVLGHEESVEMDSITMGRLEAPAFTRPRDWHGISAPEILLSGNHAKIEDWKLFVGLLVTLQKRPDVLTMARFLALGPQLKKRFLEFANSLTAAELELLGLHEIDHQQIQQIFQQESQKASQ